MRYRGNVFALVTENRRNGLDVSAETCVPNWGGEVMDGDMAVGALYDLEKKNKLHWAIHGHTAAEVIVNRADAEKQHMGLITWKDAPAGKIQKFDVSVAKNYLNHSEMAQLSRLVNAYLDVAEDMAQRQIPMTMQDWETRLNRFIRPSVKQSVRSHPSAM